jgi:GntR family transcriptional regulator
MRQRGLKATSVVTERRSGVATQADAEALDIATGDPVEIIERVRLADGVPMAIERAVLPAAIADDVSGVALDGSLHRAFEDAGHHPSKAAAEVSARLSTDYEQEHLDLEPASVVLSEERTIFNQHGVALEHTVTVYVADRYSFTAMLFPHATESPQG